jgi:UDP-N-acetylmuramoyl-tripeptide--D-alanyl-D-alanine ligase
MSSLWTSDALATATDGKASADFTVSGVTFDSREVGPGDLFVAMKGEATDGHRFLDGAFANGAAAALVSQPISQPHILVADVNAALDALGVASRGRTAAKVAGVTGSVGKTGTKEALAAALARGNKGSVHRSVKSYNNHTGVPLSLARMPAASAFGVFEMGMNHAGELAQLTRLVRPHVALVTAIAPAHIEFFGSEDAIADAKGEIFQGLEPGGTAIIPFDSRHRDRLIAAARPYAANIVTFGRGDGADVRALDEVGVAGGTQVTAMLPGADLCFTISQAGDHWVSNALAIIAAVQALGGDLAAAGLALADFEGLPGRGAQYRVAVGDGEALILDESYNANAASMAATLKVLGNTEAKRRIAVLGEMRELGADSDALHAGIADPLLTAGADFALLVGDGMKALAKALEGQMDYAHVDNAAIALDTLTSMVRGGDAVLIKGSNAVGLSRIVDALRGGKI